MTDINVTTLQQGGINLTIIEELQGAITEGVFNSRWTLIETYHSVGRILAEHEKELPKNYVKVVADILGQKERLIYQCCQFFRKYPDLDKLPQGKNISWHKIANDLLPEHKGAKATQEELLAARIEAFIKTKGVKLKIRTEARQLIEEWESFKREAKSCRTT